MLFLFLFGFCFCFVVNIDGVVFDHQDFYSKYTRAEWEGAPEKHKKSILEDYVKRESCALEAKKNGFDRDPFVIEKFLDIKNQLLVNFSYEEFVAKPLIGEEVLSLGKTNLKEEVFVKHVLISFNNSSLSSPPSRTKEEAFKLSSFLVDSLKKTPELFESFAKKHSDDPSVSRNNGVLGWLQWGRAPLAFQVAAWALDINNVSAPVLTDYGYHILFVSEKRDSEFSFYGKSDYERAVLSSSLPSVNKQLRSAALLYDEDEFRRSGVVFHENGLNSFFKLYSKHKEELFSAGKKHFDFSRFVQGLEDRFLICSFLGEDYGLAWFALKSKGVPPSKIPVFKNTEEVVLFFKTFVLRELAIRKALDINMDSEGFFINRFEGEKNRILYDSYLKFLVNSITIDSSSVKQYFLMNRDEKYINPEKVVVSQIKVQSSHLADSLFSLLEKDGALFESFARKFSINRQKEAGLMEPFERGKYNDMGEVAFSLGLNEISTPISNLDKTYSIIRLEKKIPREYLDINKVYKRIESLLLKEGQDNIKKDTFNKYINNKGVVFSEEFKPFFN